MTEFKNYRRTGTTEMRPYVQDEDVTNISISQVDKMAGSPKIGDWIVRNPKDHNDQWLVSAAYFASQQFEEV